MTLRIVLTDPLLLKQLDAHRTGAQLVAVKASELGNHVGKADIFLLDDDTAIRFLGARSEASWPSVVVIAGEKDPLPASFRQGIVDDLLVLPLRALDVERMIRAHELMQALHDLEGTSHGVGELVRQLQEDITLAQKIQRRLIREKFAPLGPLSVKSKYWCGLKSGGDYFDFFEFPGGTHAGLLLADSSSYALSTSLIGSLMQFSVHVGKEDFGDPTPIVEALTGKLREGMKERDRLSLLYGILDRKTYSFRYVDFGGVFLAKRSSKGAISWGAKGDNPAVTSARSALPSAREIMLEPGDRLIACSDGWGEALAEPMAELMEGGLNANQDSQELLNGLAFRLRRTLEKNSEEPVKADDDFPMPPQDCSVLIFDLAANVLRLAK
ncbi:MAG: PP2C family protein-serine/threonine phosphatase [Bdellovibrionota bacterium]